MTIADAIEHYHSLLTGTLLDNAGEALHKAMIGQNLSFRSRPVCSVLRPFFMPLSHYRPIKEQAEVILSAIRKVGEALPHHPSLRSALGLTPAEERLIEIDPGYFGPDASGRMDGFPDSQGRIRFIEYNADSPGGLLFGEALGDVFMGMEIMREFSRRYPVRAFAIRAQLTRTLIDCFREWRYYSSHDLPHIAIVDWEGVATRQEFEICREYFASRGIPAIITTPEALEYRGGWLRVGDFRINLIYKRVVLTEFLERYGLDHPMVRAVKDRAVCLVNGFRVQALTQKSLFAVLDDPAFEHLFSAQEIATLRRHLPWTRALREGAATYRGRRIDLLEFVASHREEMILKPSAHYGGRGVVLGWQCDEDQWRRKLAEALGARFVVQERIDIPRQTFPVIDERGVRLEHRFHDFSPYTWRGDLAEGAGIRLSSSAMLNVTAGGGSATPLMILADM